MAGIRFLLSGIATTLFGGFVAACGGSDEPARLSLQWVTQDEAPASVSPSETLQSVLIVRNEGGRDLDEVSLRFNQNETGDLPYGISIGTVTNFSSRFEGDDQVWDLGPIGAGDGIAFPIALWFEASSRTAEPLAVHLVMIASSPGLPDETESNEFEVTVDTRQASGR